MTQHEDGIEDASQPLLNDLPNVSTGKAIGYGIANFGFGSFYALNNFILSLYLRHFTHNGVIIGLGGSTHSFEGAVIQPLIGSSSDRMQTKWGRRRPFILAAIPVSTLFLLLTPGCAHLPQHARLGAMVACIFLFTLTFNIAQDPYNALLADITPEPQRGRVTGISMFIFQIGYIILLLLPAKLGPVTFTTELKFCLCAGIMLLTTIVTCLWIKEPARPREIEEIRPKRRLARSAWEGLVTLRQARKALVVTFLSGLGIGAVFPFLTIFVTTIGHCTDAQAELMAAVLIVTTAIFVLPFGWLADRIGPRAVLIIGLSLIACASAAGLWVGTMSQIRFVMIIAGIGNGAQFASAYPLLYSLVTPQEVGLYTGLKSTAESIATPLTAIVTGVLVNVGGYRSIFLVCSVCVVGAILVLVTLRRSAAPGEIQERELILAEAAAAGSKG